MKAIKNILNNIGFYLVYGFWYALSLLPMWLHYVLGDILGWLLGSVVGYRRKVIRRNLANAYPDKSEAERRDIERGFYRYFGEYIAETVKFASMSEKSINRHITFEGVDKLNEILNSGQSIALMLGHYGNWEWVTSLASHVSAPDQTVALGQIYHPLENPVMDRVMLRVRNRFASKCISMNDTLRWVIGHKHEGHVTMVGYISDQVPLWWNIHHWLTFLNQDTPVFTGVERIARKQHQAVAYVDVFRVSRGHYRCEMRILTREPQDLPPYEVTNRYFAALEQTINRAPQYWLWSHNRWKRTHAEFDRRYQVVNGRVIERKP